LRESHPTILGIDVGMSGALSFYDTHELIIYDMPVNERSNTRRIDFYAVQRIIEQNKPDHAFVEFLNAFGMGASSAFNFGWSAGGIEAVLSCLKVPYTYVSPRVWKRAMDCHKDKDASRARASQLLPHFAHNWDRKKDHNRAEASMLALYGLNKLNQQKE
jgi:hypothetical protein